MKIRAPYFLQWNIILEAKANGFAKYNMWGIVPEGSQSLKALQGVSDFKKSFGGYEINYVGAIETFVYPKYYIQRVADWLAYRKDR